MPIDNEKVDHGDSQTITERLERWLYNALGERRQTWPPRGDECIRNLRLHSSVTPFWMFLGRNP